MSTGGGHDLTRLDDKQFEELCFLLVKTDYPMAQRLRAPDGGLDVIARIKAPEPQTLGWQVKHYPGAIHWAKCRESMDRALRDHAPERVTFCFPRDFTRKELEDWDTFVAQYPQVELLTWDGSYLRGRLALTEQGERIARNIFGWPQAQTIELLARAGGDIQTPPAALDRIGAAVERLTGDDPLFQHEVRSRRVTDESPPLAPGTVLSVELRRHDSPTVERIEVRPKPDGSPSLGIHIGSPDPEAAKANAQRLNDLHQFGGRTELEQVQFAVQGLTGTVGELFRMVGGTPLDLSVEVRPQVESFPARFEMHRPDGEPLRIDMELSQVQVEDPGEIVLEGDAHGLRIRTTATFDPEVQKGTLGLSWQFTLGRGFAGDQLVALRLAAALCEPGELLILDCRSGVRRARFPTTHKPRPDEFTWIEEYLVDLSRIETASGRSLAVRVDFTEAELGAIAATSDLIRDRGRVMAVPGVSFVTDFTTRGRDVRPNISYPLGLVLAGETFDVGTESFVLPELPMIATTSAAPGPKPRVRWRYIPERSAYPVTATTTFVPKSGT